MQLYRITYTDTSDFVTNEWFTNATDMHSRVERLTSHKVISLRVEDLTVPDTPHGMAHWLNRLSNTPAWATL